MKSDGTHRAQFESGTNPYFDLKPIERFKIGGQVLSELLRLNN